MLFLCVTQSEWFVVAERRLIVEEPWHHRGGRTATMESPSYTETGEEVPSEDRSSHDGFSFLWHLQPAFDSLTPIKPGARLLALVERAQNLFSGWLGAPVAAHTVTCALWQLACHQSTNISDSLT